VTASTSPVVEEGDCRYLPLEVLQERYTDLPKADVFSLALTIYEAVLVSCCVTCDYFSLDMNVKYCDEHSVYALAYLENHVYKLHQIFCLCCVWPCCSPDESALLYMFFVVIGQLVVAYK